MSFVNEVEGSEGLLYPIYRSSKYRLSQDESNQRVNEPIYLKQNEHGFPADRGKKIVLLWVFERNSSGSFGYAVLAVQKAVPIFNNHSERDLLSWQHVRFFQALPGLRVKISRYFRVIFYVVPGFTVKILIFVSETDK